ncbi:MAG: hypothetical protein ACYCX3_00095 [Thermoleophilia bacterium]
MTNPKGLTGDFEGILAAHLGDSLLTVLKALGSTECTGSINVVQGENAGVIFMEGGEIVDALVNDGTWVGEGIGAVAFLANLDYPQLSYSTATTFGKRTIRFEFTELQELVDQARPLLLPPQRAAKPAKRSRTHSANRPAKHAEPTVDNHEPDPTGTPFEVFIEQLETEAAAAASTGDERGSERRPSAHGRTPSPHAETVSNTRDAESTARTQEASIMALDTYLNELKGINGYLAAGIMTFTGEMLASDTADPNIDLGMVGAMFNDIFRTAHEASKKIGLQACKETIITTPVGTIVMRCSGVDAKAHVHIVSILKADGNQALMKMQIDKMVPAIIDELG